LAALRSAIFVSGFALICAGSGLVSAAELNVAGHRERVIKIISEHLGLERAALSDSTDVCSLPTIDALKHAELILLLDEAFGIRIADADIECLCVIKDIVFYVENQKRNPQTATCKKL
jgi:acyl carrier protein